MEREEACVSKTKLQKQYEKLICAGHAAPLGDFG